jgi:hypothetical protein
MELEAGVHADDDQFGLDAKRPVVVARRLLRVHAFRARRRVADNPSTRLCSVHIDSLNHGHLQRKAFPDSLSAWSVVILQAPGSKTDPTWPDVRRDRRSSQESNLRSANYSCRA